MQSNVCKIEKGTRDLAQILEECEKVAVYNGLNHKKTLQLRLLCEEIDGMLPEILGDFEGDIWIEFVESVCKINVSISYEEFSAEKKKELVSISKNNKNAAAKSFAGMIRSVVENFLLDEDVQKALAMPMNVYMPASHIDYSYLWSLEEYKDNVKAEETEQWDELEKAMLAAIADDVIVGVKGKKADIVIVKNFA